MTAGSNTMGSCTEPRLGTFISGDLSGGRPLPGSMPMKFLRRSPSRASRIASLAYPVPVLTRVPSAFRTIPFMNWSSVMKSLFFVEPKRAAGDEAVDFPLGRGERIERIKSIVRYAGEWCRFFQRIHARAAALLGRLHTLQQSPQRAPWPGCTREMCATFILRLQLEQRPD